MKTDSQAKHILQAILFNHKHLKFILLTI